MFGKRSSDDRRIAVTLLLIVAPWTVLLCIAAYSLWPRPMQFSVACGSADTFTHMFGSTLCEELNRSFGGSYQFDPVPTHGSWDSLAQVVDGNAHLAFVPDGMCFEEDSPPHPDGPPNFVSGPCYSLLPIRRAYLHVLMRVDDRTQHIETFEQASQYLREEAADGEPLSVYIGKPNSGSRRMGPIILSHYALEQSQHYDVWEADVGLATLLKRMTQGGNGPTFALLMATCGTMQSVGQFDSLRILSVDRAAGIARQRKYLQVDELPRGIYSGDRPLPTRTITTVANQIALVCRRPEKTAEVGDLSADDVKHILATATRLVSDTPDLPNLYATNVSSDNPQQAFSYALHPGATAFYRGDVSPSVLSPAFWSGFFSVMLAQLAAGIWYLKKFYGPQRRFKELINGIDQEIEQIMYSSSEESPPCSGRDVTPRLLSIKRRALKDYKDGRLASEGYQRIKEYVADCLSQLRFDDDWTLETGVVSEATDSVGVSRAPREQAHAV